MFPNFKWQSLTHSARGALAGAKNQLELLKHGTWIHSDMRLLSVCLFLLLFVVVFFVASVFISLLHLAICLVSFFSCPGSSIPDLGQSLSQ